MRRALRILSLVGLALTIACAVLGWTTARDQAARLEAGDGGLPGRGWLGLAHGVAGHAAAATCCAVAAIAFVLGLQGLLETGGHRWRGAALFVMGPLLMGFALAAEVSGLRGWREGALSLASEAHAGFVRGHALLPGVGLVSAAALMAVAAWGLARPDEPPAS